MDDLIRKVFESKVKAFDDKTLTIEHFISTEKVDRSKDIMKADGMVMDGIPVVLKQHGFDPDTGNEPIAKPLSITVATNDNGDKGILVKTQYYNGSHLTPPDNTGQRLYEKAKDGTMPYWSIGFRGIDQEPRPQGGTLYLKWLMFEYSQVGVPDNTDTGAIKSIEDAEKIINKNPNTFYKFNIEKETQEPEKSKAPEELKNTLKFQLDELESEIPKEDIKSLQNAINKAVEKNEGRIINILEALENSSKIYFKSIAERVAEELPYDSMRTIWWGFLDELYTSDGKEKTVNAIIKEYISLLKPFAIAFAQATTENPEDFIEVKNTINKNLSVDKEEPVDDPAPSDSVKTEKPTGNSNTFKFKQSRTVKLKPSLKEKTIKLPCSVDTFKKELTDITKEAVKSGIDKMKGVVD